jgi:aldehyde dehydrogenase (NAD+)
VAPDYVLIPRSAQDAFVEAIKEAAVELRVDDALASDSYSSIISEGHYKRLRGLMTKSLGNVVVGGSTDDEKRRIMPTVYRDVKEGDSLLEGYVLPWISIRPIHFFPLAKFLALFCPLFPWTTFGRRSSILMPSRSYRQHHNKVNSFCISPHPLVLYAFTGDADIKQARSLPFPTCSRSLRSHSHWPVRDETRSGGIHFNDVVQHMSVDVLPFSGIGESGCT